MAGFAVQSAIPGPYGFAPYCGLPPARADLLTRWNLDPILIAALAALALAYVVASRTRPPLPRWRTACFYCGWAITTLALISPLCPLSVSLFAARVGQHMILTTIAAPLVALGLPFRVFNRPDGVDRPSAAGGALMAATVFAAALWFWHAPAPYVATFQSDVTYWLMHLTLYGSALWLWTTLFSPAPGHVGGRAAATILTTLQMGFLGAAITFAQQALYRPHEFTSWAWGLTPLQDQQLGGVIMWIPSGGILLAGLLLSLSSLLRTAEGSAFHPQTAR